MRAGRRMVTTGLVALAFLLVLTGLATMWLTRDQPGARSLDSALRDFRAGDSTGIESIGALVTRPQPGVYEATGSGRASIDVPPTSQNYGATIPVTVRLVDQDCWTTQVDVNTAFSQAWEYCAHDGTMTEHSNHTTTRWDFGFTSVTEHSTFVCDPPGTVIHAGEHRDDVSQYTCIGSGDAVSGTTESSVTFTMVGPEVVEVDGTSVPTFHYREDDILTGAQRGTTRTDFWYSVDSFLLVAMDRSIDLRTDSPIGTVTYTEDGSWRLASLTPLR